jgi:hypothetical protein
VIKLRIGGNEGSSEPYEAIVLWIWSMDTRRLPNTKDRDYDTGNRYREGRRDMMII